MARTLQLWHVLLGLPVLAYSQMTTANLQPTSTINSQADATALAASAPTFTGSVLISSMASETIDLHGLTNITGNVICENATALTTIQSDTLVTIGALFHLNGLTSFTMLSLPSLQSVGGEVLIEHNPALMTVSLPLLESVGFHFQEIFNDQVANVSLPNLQSVGGALVLTGVVTSVNLAPALSVAGDAEFEFTSTFNCTTFEQSYPSLTTGGQYVCTSNTTSYDRNKPTWDDSWYHNAQKRAGVIAGIAIGAFLIAVGGGYLFVRFRRYRAVKAGRMHKDHDIMLAERRGIPELVNDVV